MVNVAFKTKVVILPMSLFTETLSLLHNYGIRPQKQLGQNFLIDQNILDIIIESAELSPDDLVIEIGAGTGILTQRLASSSSRIIAVELDRWLFQILQSTCQNKINVIPIRADILNLNFSSLVREIGFDHQKIKVIGNLPYYITTPIIMKVLDESLILPIQMMMVMVQEEVGMRILASPGTKDYGALSVAISYRADSKIIKYISAGCFYPEPKVDSVIVRMNIKDKPSVCVKDENFFFQIVRSAFQYRRKTLRNALLMACGSGGISLSVTSLDLAMQSLGIDPKRRGETLSIADFAELSNMLSSFK